MTYLLSYTGRKPIRVRACSDAQAYMIARSIAKKNKWTMGEIRKCS